jgi:hypothetical protein
VKHISILTILLTFSINPVLSQFSKEEDEVLEIVNSQDSLPRNIFLDSTLLVNMKLQATNTRQIWSSKSKTEKQIDQLFDIRLEFPTHDAAMDFHQKYLAGNSEYGPEIKKHKIPYAGAGEFRVYKGTDLINKMAEVYGLQMYCYPFFVENYFVKVYITCNKEYKPEKFQDLIGVIISRIKKYLCSTEYIQTHTH